MSLITLGEYARQAGLNDQGSAYIGENFGTEAREPFEWAALLASLLANPDTAWLTSCIENPSFNNGFNFVDHDTCRVDETPGDGFLRRTTTDGVSRLEMVELDLNPERPLPRRWQELTDALTLIDFMDEFGHPATAGYIANLGETEFSVSLAGGPALTLQPRTTLDISFELPSLTLIPEVGETMRYQVLAS